MSRASGLDPLIDNSNVPLSAVAGAFAASPEFIQTYGALADDDFVKQLYLNALGRPADAPGEKGWDDVLASGTSRGTVAESFAESRENKLHTVSTAGDTNDAEVFRLYQTAFNRTPDQGGADFWASALAGGSSPQQVAQSFIGSAEFQGIYGGLTPATLFLRFTRTRLVGPPISPGWRHGRPRCKAARARLRLSSASPTVLRTVRTPPERHMPTGSLWPTHKTSARQRARSGPSS